MLAQYFQGEVSYSNVFKQNVPKCSYTDAYHMLETIILTLTAFSWPHAAIKTRCFTLWTRNAVKLVVLFTVCASRTKTTEVWMCVINLGSWPTY